MSNVRFTVIWGKHYVWEINRKTGKWRLIPAVTKRLDELAESVNGGEFTVVDADDEE